MACCSTDGANRFFSKSAKRYAKTFRKKGPDKASSFLISSLTQLGLASKSVLDIGCGVGNVHLTLLKNGAASAFGVDVAEGMLKKARELAAELGLSEKVQYHHGDVTQSNGSIPPADVVVLDKVLCCHKDPETLIRNSTERCRELYATTYPRNSLLARITFRTPELLGRLLRWSFHPYYHETVLLENAIGKCGFEEISSSTTIIWQMKVFRRIGGR